MENLEKLYSPSRWSKRGNSTEVQVKHVQFLENHSKLAKEKIPSESISYGQSPREKFDVYGTDLKDDSPILIHIHGGYYQEEALTHTNNGFISNIFYENGIKTILLGYELCQQKTLRQILDGISNGLKECLKYAVKLNSRGMYISGHSVGAHAIAYILQNLKTDLIKSVFLLCGIYNLEPLIQMSANDLLKLSSQEAKDFSPLLNGKINYGKIAIYIFASEWDSPAFVKQSEEFYEKLQQNQVKCYLNVIPKVDHFDVIENLYYEDFELTKIILQAIKE
ncbi:unnamed protein product [Ceutorhynchus assimilis]|uniref:Kynurenine formamidase n=1 Tax=Ceutorhynchus assimilis TaxID=467358 RepID=A0A9N9MY86_9CUCU|nr:unnamed protein product [Ceutorhynchus assimilis]